jgi:hypothetical protein
VLGQFLTQRWTATLQNTHTASGVLFAASEQLSFRTIPQ